MTRVFIAIGSNLKDPIKQVETAVLHLENLPRSSFLCVSSLYRSKPLGPSDQPDYINAVACIETALSPRELLNQLQAIETLQGRRRKGTRWGPRVIDLDIVLYGTRKVAEEDLIIPHPGLYERDFVLIPLAEIASDLILPSGESILAFKSSCIGLGIVEKL